MQGYLVAETDERGHVQCVWLHSKHTRTPQPVKIGTVKVSDLASFEVHGASQQAVIDWLVSEQARLGKV